MENKKKTKSKRKLIIWISIIVLFIVVTSIFGIVDFERVKDNKEPIFTISENTYWDGGTKSYVGIGYSIQDNNKICIREDITKDECNNDIVLNLWFFTFKHSK